MKKLFLLLPFAFCLFTSCAAQPRTYHPPDSTRLKQSTTRVSVAVDKAHASARAAKAKVDEARKRQKEIATEVKALKDVPASLVEKINTQDQTLEDASVQQVSLETSLTEADKAKAQVEKDKIDYFNAAQKMADDATKDNHRALSIEQEVNRYWGLGGILYGFKRLAGHLLILAAVLIGVVGLLIVLSFFIPALGPVLAIATSLWGRFIGLFRRKPG